MHMMLMDITLKKNHSQFPNLNSKVLEYSFGCMYLISSYKMENDTDIGKVNEPVWFIKSKSRENISRSLVAKCSISKTSTAKKEESGDKNGSHCCFLHCPALRWWCLQCILQVEMSSSTVLASKIL